MKNQTTSKGISVSEERSVNHLIIQSTSSVSNLESFRNQVIQEWQQSGVKLDYILWLFHNFSENGSGLFIADADEVRDRLNMPRLDLSHQQYFWGFKDLFGNIQIKVNLQSRKYMCPKGSTSDAFFLPLMEYPNCKDIKQIMLDFRSVSVVEGIKKCASLISNGDTATLPISIVGVNCSLPDADKRLILSEFLLTAVELKRPVFVVFDKDWESNKQVGKALLKTHAAYQELGLDTYTPIWETDHKGIDDYLGSLEPNKRHKAIMDFVDDSGKTLTPEQVREQLEKIYSQKPGNKGKSPTAQDICDSIIEEYRPNWKYSLFHQSWLYWNDKYWELKNAEIIASQVQRLLKKRNIRYGSSSKIDDVCKQLRRELQVSNWMNLNQCLQVLAKPGERIPPRYLNLANGIYDTKTRELIDHSQDAMFTSMVNREFDESLASELTGDILVDLQNYAPVWHKSYLEVAESQTKLLRLLATINAILTYRLASLQKFVCLIGAPGSGKSSFARLVNAMIGDENTVFTSLGKLNEPYTVATFIDKQLTVCDDEEKQSGFESLRKLTGGSPVSFRPIYGKPDSAVYYGSVLVSAVKFPFTGDTSGIRRRLSLIKFDGKFKKREPSTEDYILENELKALMVIALSMKQTEVDGYVSGELEHEDDSFLKDGWDARLDGNKVASWMDLFTVQDESADVPIGLLRQRFSSWCQDNGYTPLTVGSFSEQLYDNLEFLGWEFTKAKDNLKSIDGKKVRCVRGIKLRSGFNEISDTISESLNKAVTVLPDSPNQDGERVSAVTESENQSVTPVLPTVTPVTDNVSDDTVAVTAVTESNTAVTEDGNTPKPSQDKGFSSSNSGNSQNSTLKMYDLVSDTGTWEQWESSNGFYPNPKSNNVRTSKKLCKQMIEQLTNCTTKEDIEHLEASPNYQRQFVWVSEIAKMFDYSEYHHYLECLKRSQQSLF